MKRFELISLPLRSTIADLRSSTRYQHQGRFTTEPSLADKRGSASTHDV